MAHVQSPATAAERLAELPGRLERQEGFAEVVAELARGGQATLEGAWGSSCALIAAALAERAAGPLVVVLPQPDDVDDFLDDLAVFSRCCSLRFPALEAAPLEAELHDELGGERLRALKALAGASGPRVVAASIQGLLQPVPSKDSLAAGTRQLAVGRTLEAEPFLRWLAERGFHATTAVQLPGEFSPRGGLIDIFAPEWTEPVRIELFGDEIASLRRFDVATQRSLDVLSAIDVTVPPGETPREHFASHLPAGSLFMLVETPRLEDEGRRYLARLDEAQRLHTVADVLRQTRRFGTAYVSSLASGMLGATCRLPIGSVEQFSGDIAKVRDELERAGEGLETFVVCQTEAEVRRLEEMFAATQLAAAGRLHFPIGRLRRGFRLASEGIVLIGGNELFHRGDLVRTQRRRLGKPIDSFLSLREGELVVHLAHGIGRYRGMSKLQKDGQIEEHLAIEFHGGTKIYVPAAKIDLVQKYVGGTRARPALARIGSATWVRQKRAAEAAVSDLAADMLEVQASRTSRAGIPFPPDTDWQHEFDASFPYRETTDQLSAIGAIKEDMRQPRPMDRLLCGDVGFGKTELAMRAAFKAVDSGYQVAVLVPTTVLCEQHYHTFRERMAEFPFRIARLSRFCTAAEQRQVVEEMRTGAVDIVIGTHRLASADVAFHNLGLVIIDEEQRFGVEVKERLKALRTTVDVLTMTATPIPRTLHMSLVGLRDISNLESPPEDRLAIETHVARFDQELIRHAVMRELSRGGQIYFVHNRVQDIEAVARALTQTVPEARLRIGHGQMPEGELEQVMVDFVNHRFDLLLATTIVESGLDIPNANSIFIDEADRYGLADLHQLRGRVGRYKHRAYCYLLLEPHKHITPNAAKRLRAIEEFSQLGAGFAIAMRDLEIRGAGNILGTQQSGHIAAVGYELYCTMLEAAVRRLKRMPPKVSIDVDLDLPGPAYLPDAYVGDMRQKIDLYRRLTRILDDGQLAELRGELVDRFGPIPDPVERMLALASLKMDAAVWRIASIHIEEQYLVLGYGDRQRAEELARRNGGRLRLVDERSAYLTLPQKVMEPDAILNLAKSVLRPR